MTQELMLLSRGEDAKPVLGVSETTRLYLDALVARVKALGPVDSPAAFTERTETLNALHKAHKTLDDERLRLGRFYDQQKEENVGQPAKKLLTPLAELKAKTQAELQAWALKVEELKRQHEAEAEAERLKAQQLAQEAQRRQEVAADAVGAAKTEEEFNAAANDFDKGVAKNMEANDLLINAGQVPAPEMGKGKGVKQKMKVDTLEVTDLAALPLTYHQADLKKLEKHILDGTLTAATPGLRFRLVPAFSASGR